MADDIPIDVTDNITHDDFVTGVHDKTIGIQVMWGAPAALVTGTRRIVVVVLLAFYFLAPIIGVPLWAYHEGNWWLLLGIAFATFVAPRDGCMVTLFLPACICFWVGGGIHNYFTFFSLCGLWGYLVFHLGERADNAYAIQSLMESPELFGRAITNARIRIVRRT